LERYASRRNNRVDPGILHLLRKYLNELQLLTVDPQNTDAIDKFVQQHQPEQSMPYAASLQTSAQRRSAAHSAGDRHAQKQRKQDLDACWEDAMAAAGVPKVPLHKGRVFRVNKGRVFAVRKATHDEDCMQFKLGEQLKLRVESAADDLSNQGCRQVRILREVAPPTDELKNGAAGAQRDGRTPGLNQDEVVWIAMEQLHKATPLTDDDGYHITAGATPCTMLVVLWKEAQNQIPSTIESRFRCVCGCVPWWSSCRMQCKCAGQPCASCPCAPQVSAAAACRSGRVVRHTSEGPSRRL